MTEQPKHKSEVDSTANTESGVAQSPEKCSPWLLFAMPIGVGVGLGIVVSLVQSLQQVDTRSIYLGLDGMRFPLAMALFSLIAAAVAMLFIRPKFKTIATLGVGMSLLACAFVSCVRVDSFYGNMIPRLAWRWTPTAEQQVTVFLTTTSKAPSKLLLPTSKIFESNGHDFPQFLGPQRTGVISGVNLASDWDANPPKSLWRHPVGLGWASFAIIGEAAITLEQRGATECVVCYNLRSGEEIWSHAESSRFSDEHGDGPRSTPTIFADRVFSLGANGLLTCLSLETGELLWKQATLQNPNEDNVLWGMSGSPLIYDGQVMVTPGAGEGASAMSFLISSGKEAWRSGDDRAGYASPIEAELCGERQLLSFNGEGLRAYAVDGTPLWLHPWLTQGESQRVNVAQPVVIPNPVVGTRKERAAQPARVLISSGYDNGTALLEVTRTNDEWTVSEVWSSKHLKSKMSNLVTHENFIYGLDNGILTCIDLADGKRKWKRGRYGHGQMLLVGNKLLIQAETGEIVLVAATPESHQELSKFNALFSKTWNNLAIAGNILVVRNDREAAAFELPVE